MTRLLVVDDHPMIISGLEAVLRQTDFVVAGVETDSCAALRAVEQVRPDILILDVRMRSPNGIEILAALRNRGDLVRVVLLTADLGDADLLRALELGVAGIVLKESAAARLVDCLNEVRRGGRWIEPSLLQRALDVKMQGTGAGQGLARLSKRESTIAKLVAEGLRNREIAAALAISEGTVKVHLHRIYEKLHVGSRTELAILVRSPPDWQRTPL